MKKKCGNCKASEPALRLKPPHCWTPEELDISDASRVEMLKLCGERRMESPLLEWTWDALQELVQWWLSAWFAQDENPYTTPEVRAKLPETWRRAAERDAERVREHYDPRLRDEGVTPIQPHETLFVYALHKHLQLCSRGRDLDLGRMLILLRGVEGLENLNRVKSPCRYWLRKARQYGLDDRVSAAAMRYALLRFASDERELAFKLPAGVLAVTAADQPPYVYIYRPHSWPPVLGKFKASDRRALEAAAEKENERLEEMTRDWGHGDRPQRIVIPGGHLLQTYFSTTFARCLADEMRQQKFMASNAGTPHGQDTPEDDELQVVSLDALQEPDDGMGMKTPIEPQDPAALDQFRRALDRIDSGEIIGALGSSLPDRQFTVLWEVDVLGRSQEDVAELLGVSPARVSQLRKRALQNAKRILQKM